MAAQAVAFNLNCDGSRIVVGVSSTWDEVDFLLY